jgi:hypothetical protein
LTPGRRERYHGRQKENAIEDHAIQFDNVGFTITERHESGNIVVRPFQAQPIWHP